MSWGSFFTSSPGVGGGGKAGTLRGVRDGFPVGKQNWMSWQEPQGRTGHCSSTGFSRPGRGMGTAQRGEDTSGRGWPSCPLHLQATADTGFWAEVPITRPRRAGFLGGCEGMKPQQVNRSWTGLGALARMPHGLGAEKQPPRPLEIIAGLPCPFEGTCHTESRDSLPSPSHLPVSLIMAAHPSNPRGPGSQSGPAPPQPQHP